MKSRTLYIASICLLSVVAACGSSGDASDGGEASGSGAVTTSSQGSTESTASEEDAPPEEAPEETASGPICALATDDEISTIVGNPVVGVDIDPTLCEYSQVSGAPGEGGTTVDLFVNAAFDDVCSLELDITGAGDGQSIEGVGKIAMWEAGAPISQLFVCTGSSFVTITQYQPVEVSDDESLARAEGIADVVLANL